MLNVIRYKQKFSVKTKHSKLKESPVVFSRTHMCGNSQQIPFALTADWWQGCSKSLDQVKSIYYISVKSVKYHLLHGRLERLRRPQLTQPQLRPITWRVIIIWKKKRLKWKS